MHLDYRLRSKVEEAVEKDTPLLNRIKRATQEMEDLSRNLFEPMLQVMTGRPNLRVILTTGTNATDGTNVYLGVPLKLGDDTEHTYHLCGKRDAVTLAMLCPKCAVLDEVMSMVGHESAHIVEESFTPISDSVKIEMYEKLLMPRILAVAPDKEANARKALMSEARLGGMGVAKMLDLFLPLMTNVVEDVFVNERLYQERPGFVLPIMRSSRMHLTEGHLDLESGKHASWLEADAEARAIMVAYAFGIRQDWIARELGEDVLPIADDERIVKLMRRIGEALTPSDRLRVAVEVLELIREHGFCVDTQSLVFQPVKMKPMPGAESEPQESEESDDDGEGEGEGKGEESEQTEKKSECSGEPAPKPEPGSGEEDEQDEQEPHKGSSASSGSDDDEDDDESEDESASGGKSDDDEDDDDESDESGDDGDDFDDDDADDDEEWDDDDFDDDDEDGQSAPNKSNFVDHEDDSSVESSNDVSDGEKHDPGEVAKQERKAEEDRASEVEMTLKQFMGHPDKDDEDEPSRPELEEALLQLHLEQKDLFDDLSTQLTEGVSEIKLDTRRGFDKIKLEGLPTDGEISPSLLKMRLAFTENRKIGIQRNLTSGPRLDTAHLHRVAIDDARIFANRSVPKRRDWFVSLALDMSGSTAGCWDEVIAKGGYAISELLSRLGIRFAVYGHTGSSTQLYMIPVKAPDEPWTDTCRKRIVALHGMTGNLDGHTLEFHRKLVERQRATDKLIMYFTDGAMPATNYSEELPVLKKNIVICQRKGIHLVGVGCGNTEPRKHGLDTILYNGINDVPFLVSELAKRLV